MRESSSPPDAGGRRIEWIDAAILGAFGRRVVGGHFVRLLSFFGAGQSNYSMSQSLRSGSHENTHMSF